MKYINIVNGPQKASAVIQGCMRSCGKGNQNGI